MRNIVITGASRGIGASVARKLADPQTRVLLNYATSENAARAVANDVEAPGGRAVVHQADVSDEAAVTAMFAHFDAVFGQLDGLVNNAGILVPIARLDEMDAARISRLLAVNVVGAFLCAREAVRRMSTRHPGHDGSGGKGGAIVNASSRACALGSAFEFSNYAASKGAIDTMTTGLAREVASEGIRVNAVRPGLIVTDLHAQSGDANRVVRLLPGVPMGRTGSAEEVADAVAYLLSAQAFYVTGTFLDVTGGR